MTHYKCKYASKNVWKSYLFYKRVMKTFHKDKQNVIPSLGQIQVCIVISPVYKACSWQIGKQLEFDVFSSAGVSKKFGNYSTIST